MNRTRCLLLALLAPLLAGCANLGYYAQALGGQLEVLSRARPIDAWLADPAVAPELKAKLTRVQHVRAFAARELGLPDNPGYSQYADLERPFAVWNVYAAPEFSLTPREWCFLVVGCIAYRGYFTRAAANEYASELRAHGYDVYVGGVAAYSTLGWFDDPLLNTVLHRPETELAGILFHELAHQKLFVRGDTAFNESFAMTVEREGVRRWLADQGRTEQFAAYAERLKRHEQFMELVRHYRQRLETLYAATSPDDVMRAEKALVFDELRRDYEKLKKTWGGYGGFDGWFAQNPGNAHLAAIGMYHHYVPAFEALLARHGGDLAAFYRHAADLARLPPGEREAQLAVLAGDGAAVSAPPRTAEE
jgi:predicted aminopeptidase